MNGAFLGYSGATRTFFASYDQHFTHFPVYNYHFICSVLVFGKYKDWYKSGVFSRISVFKNSTSASFLPISLFIFFNLT
ncbi:hypothetical protein EZS27_037830 [termite gut metagenome]|uniref:Uncharacterized protein n=1 Tax=termite gut metagenome TaxID=433724 RepID=A0A5J4PRK9_9ZZZZ